jgi:Mn2+/Fe2+ NRAMP family transporter
VAHVRPATGPGLITGASDDDPSGIGTYSQAGSQFGYRLLWTSLLTFLLMAAVQEICDRTALATGTGLGELAAKAFSRSWRVVVGALLVALLVANRGAVMTSAVVSQAAWWGATFIGFLNTRAATPSCTCAGSVGARYRR